MYLTYEEYTDMGGTLSESDFDFVAYEAESYIDWYTFNRLKKYETIPQEVKDCEFHIIRLVQAKLNNMGISTNTDGEGSQDTFQQIMSQSNDGVSVSYNALSARDALQSISKEIEETIKRSLAMTMNELGQKLLYRGLYPNE